MKRLLIFEYASSGIAGAGSILTEGFAMLNFALEETRRANFQAVAVLDPRIAKLGIVEEGVEVLSDSGAFKAALGEVDAALIIAPETDLILCNLAREVEKAKIPLLGCTARGIKTATNKAKTIELLGETQVNTPESQKIAFSRSIESAEKKLRFKYPIVIKPIDGVGSAGISIVRGKAEIRDAISKARQESKLEHFLVEKYIEGEHASAGVICTSDGAVPVTLNSQKIAFEEKGLKYMGNSTPLHHALEPKAKESAAEAVLSIKGLRGYAGVDMVLTEDKVYIIEINPRLTTSCIIAGKVAGMNIIKAICEAVLDRKLPGRIKEKGFAAIERIASPREIFVSEELARTIWSLDGVVSPPLAINEYIKKGETLAFISSYDKSKSKVAKAMALAREEIYRIIGVEKC